MITADQPFFYMDQKTIAKFESRLLDEKRFGMAGHAIVFNTRSELIHEFGRTFYEIIAKGALTESLKKDEIKAFWNHDRRQILGRTSNNTLKLIEDSQSIYIEDDFPDTGYARDLHALISRGDVSGMSFGFYVYPDGELWDFKSDPPLRTITRAKLSEVSAVTDPAYTATDVGIRSLYLDKDEAQKFFNDKFTQLSTPQLSMREAAIRQAEMRKQKSIARLWR